MICKECGKRQIDELITLSEIRDAIGDNTGKYMLNELVDEIRKIVQERNNLRKLRKYAAPMESAYVEHEGVIYHVHTERDRPTN